MESIFIEQALQDLFFDLQKSDLFEDVKTIADLNLKIAPKEILQAYQTERQKANFELAKFVDEYFATPILPNTIAQQPKAQDAQTHIKQLWEKLLRQPHDLKADVYSTIIPLKNAYIVPGGRFNEIYYWDSYFTMQGLVADGKVDIVESMIDNFNDMIEEFGYIPNGNRTYFLGRSQPPFFSLMVDLLATIKGESIWQKYLPALCKEYNFWMTGLSSVDTNVNMTQAHKHVVYLENGIVLNRYYDEHDTPRIEMYQEDKLYSKYSHHELFRHIRAACESGWDFSSRWMKRANDLSTIRTLHIIPIDLNCLLFYMEDKLATIYTKLGENNQAVNFRTKATERKNAIQQICWDEQTHFYHDYDFITSSRTSILSLAAMYPLFVGIASQEQAASVAKKMEEAFLFEGGLVTTTLDTGQQWDAPNGWSPLQWIAIQGLRNYNFDKLANEIKSRWLHLLTNVFEQTGKFVEKYNVVNTDKLGGGGEYKLQDGFGWTNGVYAKLAQENSTNH